ncbi:hypothetical protein GCM10020227_39730 [Streptomyces flavovirens]
MERGEFRARVGPQAVGERPPGLLVREEGVRLPAFGAEHPDELRVQGLVVGVGRREPPQLGYEARQRAAPEVGLHALPDSGEPVGPGPHRVGTLGSGEVGERGAAPQGEGRAQGAGGGLGVPRGEFRPSPAGEPLEDVQVDVVRPRVQPVAGRGTRDRLFPQDAAQSAHEGLQGGRGVVRPVAVPHVLDERGDVGRTAGP